MDPLDIGNAAISTVGATVVATVDWISIISLFCVRVMTISRAIFHPIFFGTFLLAFFVYAWFRMEQIAEQKRLEANSRILLKKSSDTRKSLLQYTNEVNGRLFHGNGFLDVLKSMKSKGRIPLKMAKVCQPVVNAPEAKILWESSAIRIRNIPRTTVEHLKLFEHIRSVSTISIKDATQVCSQGGVGYWKDPKRKFFAKEKSVFVSFNFHDSTNFFALYTDSEKFKRLCSLSTAKFLAYHRINEEGRTITFDSVIEDVRFADAIFFNAVCLLICHAQLVDNN